MSCKRRNQRSTRCGDCRRTIQLVAIVTVMATAMPTNGATKMKITGLVQPETMMARNPAEAIAAPPYPPINAWDELVGSPRDNVSKFQRIAPNRPASTTCSLIKLMRTKPWPIVFATAVPNTNAAMKFQNAAQTTAHNGVRTRVETTVAIEFAASCEPLENANDSASPTINRRRLKLSKAANLAIKAARPRGARPGEADHPVGRRRDQALFNVTDSMTLATSSHLSTAVSMTSNISFHLMICTGSRSSSNN